jgi:hypothetical protein
MDKLLVHPEAATRDLRRARAAAVAGRLAWLADDMPATVAYHTEALDVFRELKDVAGQAQALADLAFHALDARDVSRANALLDEADGLIATREEPRITAHIQHIRAVITAGSGDFERAFDLEQESLAAYRLLGDAWMCLIVDWGVGVNAIALKRFDIAREHLARCIQVGLDLGNRWGTSYPLDAFACLAMAEGKNDRAARLFGAGEAQRARSGLVPHSAEHPALKAVMASVTDFAGPKIESARHEGRTLSLDAAVAFALSKD